LYLPLDGAFDQVLPWYPLAGQGDRALASQLVWHAPDPLGLLVVEVKRVLAG